MALMGQAANAAVRFSNKKTRTFIGKKRPNIIYILADDLGYGDVGCYGQLKVRTPNIDKLAAEGMMFTQHYAGSTVCAPSRCSLLTGLHTGHCYIRGNYETGGYQKAIPAETVTIAEVLKGVGYNTSCIGKWGLGGPDTEGLPNLQGFDHFFGYLGQVQAHNYYPDHLWRNTEQVPLGGTVYSHDLLTEEALGFIAQNEKDPFFLYLAYTIPHSAIEVPEIGDYASEDWSDTEKKFAAMVTRMDADVGRIIDLLKKLGLDSNTIVMFTSDNGPHSEGGHSASYFDSNGIYRGIKRALYEGGIREPMVVRWPGKIKPGIVSDHISAMWDIFPTCCELAGAQTPDGLDGISFVPALLGKSQKQHEYLYWEFHEYGGKQAVRKGKWKGVRLNMKTVADPPVELYDLEADPSESTNLTSGNPTKAAELKALMIEAHVTSPIFKFYGE